MKFARIRHNSEIHLARIEDEHVVLLEKESDKPRADVMIDAITLQAKLDGDGVRVSLGDVKLLAPVRRPGKIVAIGLNYADHAVESDMELPSAPLIFSKPSSAIVGPGEPVRWVDADCREPDYEAELAVIIGTTATGQVANPLEHIFGYTCCNDFSARDAQFGDGQWVRGKSYDTFCPLGPWIVTPEEFGHPSNHKIGIDVTDPDGAATRLQDGNTSQMIFDVAEIITYVARFITLEPGDVIATGTPDGVGFARKPPRYMANGDVMSVWIEGIGELTNPCVVDR